MESRLHPGRDGLLLGKREAPEQLRERILQHLVPVEKQVGRRNKPQMDEQKRAAPLGATNH